MDEGTTRADEIRRAGPIFARSAIIAQRQAAQDLAGEREIRIQENQKLTQDRAKRMEELAIAKSKAKKAADIAAASHAKFQEDQKTEFFGHVNALNSTYRPDSPEYNRAMVALGANYPLLDKDTRVNSAVTTARTFLMKNAEDPDLPVAHQSLNRILSDATLQPEEKQQRINGLAERFSKQLSNIGFRQRYDAGLKSFAPKEPLPEGAVITGGSRKVDGGSNTFKVAEKDKPDTPSQRKQDSFAAIQTEKSAAEKLYGRGKVPPEVIKRLEERGKAVESGAATGGEKESPEQIVARIKSGGGTKEDAVKALRDAGHSY